jgi:hypothetical protein
MERSIKVLKVNKWGHKALERIFWKTLIEISTQLGLYSEEENGEI